MGRVMRVCRVCGKDYETCHTRNTTNTFRWQNVACSVECGNMYLSRILCVKSNEDSESKTENNYADNV